VAVSADDTACGTDGIARYHPAMNVLGIRRVTIAVRDLTAARDTFTTLFGAVPGEVDALPAFGVRAARFGLGEGELRAVAPAGIDNAVQRYIERRGEGFYTLALEVDDVDAAVAELAARGVRVSEPVETTSGERSAFVAMAATHGLSIELVETARPGAEPSAEAAPAPEAVDEPPADDIKLHPWTARPELLDLTPDEWSDVD
jgi:methylmalonyl-CoA/ethylmalonyl-CoA epimerase